MEFTKTWLAASSNIQLESLSFDSRKDKYGRTLGRVYRDGDTVSLNDALLNSGNAVAYLTD